jgi:hypothetical protein
MLEATLGQSKLERGTDRQQKLKRLKGEIVKKKYATVLIAFICFLVLSVAAAAQTRNEIVVTLPFEFVVSGKTLPAGTYTVSRFADDKFEGLILSSYENRTSVFVHPVEIGSASADKPQLSFERVGGQNFLSRIQTTNDVYNIPVSRSVIVEAVARSRDNGSASGSSGSN